MIHKPIEGKNYFTLGTHDTVVLCVVDHAPHFQGGSLYEC